MGMSGVVQNGAMRFAYCALRAQLGAARVTFHDRIPASIIRPELRQRRRAV
jgi:hypothetical protein